MNDSDNKKMMVNIHPVILIVTVFISTLLFLQYIIPLDYPKSVMAQTGSTGSPFSLTNLIEQGSPFLGDLSAPITIVDFSDFQCHLCARHVKNTEPLINETYIQTGQATLVFKHLPNRGFDSMGAHLAAQCVHEQGKFWQFHKLLYENQKGIDTGWVHQENLRKFASQIPGLDLEQFNSCFNSQKYKEFIDKDIELANSQGFTDTPSFIIINSIDGSDPEVVRGAQPYPAFQSVIEKKLDNIKK